MKKLFIILTALITAMLFAESAQVLAEEAEGSPSLVRVGLFFSQSAVSELTLDSDGGFFVSVEGSDFPEYIDVNTLKISVSGGNLAVSTVFGGEVASAPANSKISVSTVTDDGKTALLGVKYYGSFEFYADGNGKIAVINVLDADEYIKGVLPSEIYPSWHEEALKAAAVVTRTYTVHSMQSSSHKSDGFDLCTTTHCQVYSGTARENERTNKAIEDTRGLVIKYNGRIATTVYTSSCGGYTESASGAWGSSPADFPYLSSVFTPYEDYRSVPNGKWESVVPIGSLSSYLSSSNTARLGNGPYTFTYTREPSGYIHSMTVTGADGASVNLGTSSAVRSFFGTLVKSANFGIARTYVPSDTYSSGVSVISADGTYDMTGIDGFSYIDADGVKAGSGVKEVYVLDGQGYGHGVGMSQFGASHMANAGFAYDEIIHTYFPGTDIVPIEE